MFDLWTGTGHVGKVGELKVSKTGVEYLHFSLAINKRRKTDEGEATTKWVECTVFNGLAQTCAMYLAPGRLVQVVGDVTARWYPGKQQIFAVLDCAVTDVRFLTSGQATDEPAASNDVDATAETESTPEAAIPNFTEPPKTGKRSRKVEAFTAF